MGLAGGCGTRRSGPNHGAGTSRLANADVILYDALVNEALLGLARPGAEPIYAGKRAGKTSCKQSDISRTLVSLARKKASACCG